jgi:transposase-like protein
MKYSNGFRARMVQRMVGPEGIDAIKLAEEIGVHQTTLSRWLREEKREKRERRGENVKSAQVRERLSSASRRSATRRRSTGSSWKPLLFRRTSLAPSCDVTACTCTAPRVAPEGRGGLARSPWQPEET